MKSASEYRQYADECRKLAALMAEPENRGQLRRMADSWDQLAEEQKRMAPLCEAPTLDRPG